MPADRNSEDSILSPEGNAVQIGTHRYLIKPVPIGRVKLFRETWKLLVERFITIVSDDDPSSDAAIDQLIGIFTDDVIDLLGVLIPDLDKVAALDPDEGVTVPEITTVVEVVLKVNRLEALKGAVPFVLSHLRDTVNRKRVNQMAQSFRDLEAAMRSAQAMQPTEELDAAV